MAHNTTDAASNSTDTPDREEVDYERERLQCVTQETRFSLIQSILSHPEQLPSLKELVFANFKKSQSTIRGHLDDLAEYEIVTEVTLPEEKRSRDLPRKFFGISEEGYAFLQDHNLLRSEETLREIYARTQKPEAIQEYEAAPRPSGDGLDRVYQASDGTAGDTHDDEPSDDGAGDDNSCVDLTT